MAITLKEDVLEGLVSPSVTDAGFNVITHAKTVPVMTNRRMNRKATYHLGGKSRGVPDVIEPCAALEMGW